MRNISAKGLQVEGEELPDRGTFLSVFVDGLVIPAGEIVWRKEKLAGIELFEELSGAGAAPGGPPGVPRAIPPWVSPAISSCIVALGQQLCGS